MDTHVWRLVSEWMQSQQFPPSQAAVARYLDVNRSAVSQWKKGQATPTPENLRAMSTMTGVPYGRFLDALLRDQGYLRTETYDATPTSQAPGSGAPSKDELDELRRRQEAADAAPVEHITEQAAETRDEGE